MVIVQNSMGRNHQRNYFLSFCAESRFADGDLDIVTALGLFDMGWLVLAHFSGYAICMLPIFGKLCLVIIIGWLRQPMICQEGDQLGK